METTLPKIKNKQWQLFADNYLKHFNASKAAVDAGYSETRANSQGYRLLRYPEIKAYVDASLEDRQAVVNSLPTEVLLDELIKIGLATVDIKEGIRNGDKIKAIDTLLRYKASIDANDRQMSNADLEQYIKALRGSVPIAWSEEVDGDDDDD